MTRDSRDEGAIDQMPSGAWPEDLAYDARTEELAANLAAVRERIATACSRAGRDDEVTLITVTKFFPASDACRLVALGCGDLGENRDQEASGKVAELAPWCEANGLAMRTHFIGQLQTNKASSVAGYADMVQSVDRLKLVRALDKAAARQGRALDVLLQVDLRGAEEIEADPGRGGASPADLYALADAVEDAAGLRLAGLMSVAPLGADPRRAFDRLAGLRRDFVTQYPAATVLSAGMSSDLEQGIEAGATHVRVGSAILGDRPADG